MRSGNGGSIINIASVIGQKGAFRQVNYAASKAGIIGLTKTLAIEGDSVHVNIIASGYIATEMTKVMPDSVFANIREQIPQKQLGTPMDITDMVHYLVSDAGKYITGQVINVNGGLY